MNCSEPGAPLIVVYDGECPFCSRYVEMQQLRTRCGGVELIDARTQPAMVRELAGLGIALDEGMAVRHAGAWHHGADAVHVLAGLAAPVTGAQRLHRWLFRSRAVTQALYPALRAGRNLTLRLLGRQPIRSR